MTKKELTCIGCPRGCNLIVTMDNETVIDIQGFSCNVGKEYAKSECTNPTRILTSIVKVNNGKISVVPCKSSTPIEKDKIFLSLKELKSITVNAPIKIGDILIKNILNTNIDIISTRDVEMK